jgi:ankyrin repeat protein
VARLLLDAGAEVDALADTYAKDNEQTTLNLLVSSVHPARAGLHPALVDVLADFGAAMNGLNDDGSPLRTALQFHYPDAADALVRRGARVDNLFAAAGLGRLELVEKLFNVDEAPGTLQIAAALGRYEVVDFLSRQPIDLAAQDNQGMTAMHWAGWYARLDIVELLLSRNAPTEVVNNYGGTVLSCTVWASRNRGVDLDYQPVIERLIAAGAKIPE